MPNRYTWRIREREREVRSGGEEREKEGRRRRESGERQVTRGFFFPVRDNGDWGVGRGEERESREEEGG
jgi:hypothetical protein